MADTNSGRVSGRFEGGGHGAEPIGHWEVHLVDCEPFIGIVRGQK